MEFVSIKYKVEFKARFAYASKEIEEKYFLVGLAEDEYDYEKYIIFQKSYAHDKEEDSNTSHNGVYVECNGDSCFNCCTSIRLSNTELRLIVSDSEIIVDIEDVKLPTNFIEYLKEIFGELLEIVDK